MSTVKITQLIEKTTLDANTANTILLGVDKSTSTTVQFTLGNVISRIVSDTGTGSYANSSFVHANAAFLAANTPNHVANSSAIYANGAFIQANAAFLAANTPNHVANSAALYANGAFIQSNAAFLVANTPNHVSNSASIYANAAFTQANAAFFRANTPDAIANSSAIYANGAFIQANASFIRANTPHAISNSASLYANGAFIQANAAFNLANNALANTTGTFSGDLTITGTIKPHNGLIYTPNVLNTITSFGLDFNRDSLVKFNINSDTSIGLSNFTNGKIVDVWITNSAAQNKVITHGCLANNSTVGSVTFNITAGHAAHLKYFSVNSDLANAFVSITA